MKTAYIVDDDLAVRDSLSVLLETHGFTVVSFESGDAFLDSDLSTVAGPVLLDVRMPGRDGLETLKALMAESETFCVIMMSGHADISMAVRALKYGAADFIEKPFAASDMLAAIDRVLPSVEAALSHELSQSDSLKRLAKLTKREMQVMALLVEGKPNKIVAADLGLSVRTVETHRAHILSKLDVKSLSDLVRLSMLEA